MLGDVGGDLVVPQRTLVIGGGDRVGHACTFGVTQRYGTWRFVPLGDGHIKLLLGAPTQRVVADTRGKLCCARTQPAQKSFQPQGRQEPRQAVFDQPLHAVGLHVQLIASQPSQRSPAPNSAQRVMQPHRLLPKQGTQNRLAEAIAGGAPAPERDDALCGQRRQRSGDSRLALAGELLKLAGRGQAPLGQPTQQSSLK